MAKTNYTHRARMMRRTRNIFGIAWAILLAFAAVIGIWFDGSHGLHTVAMISIGVADACFFAALAAHGVASHFEEKSYRIPLSNFEW